MNWAAPLMSRRDEAAAASQEAETQTAAVAAAATAAARVLLKLFANTNPPNITCPHFSVLFDSVHVADVKAMTQDRSGKVSLVLPYFHELERTLIRTKCDNAPAVLVVPEGHTGRGGAGCT